MGFKGIAIGGALGGFFGGPLGALIGAALGNRVERELARGKGSTARRAGQAVGRERARAQGDAARVFCASAAARLATIAKADGRVTPDEIASVEAAFARLGFTPAARALAIDVFRRAKDDASTMADYAREFASAVPAIEVREFLYELLWDIACADGRVTPEELEMLRSVTGPLEIPAFWFNTFAGERLGGARHGQPNARRELDEAYALLGVSPAASDDEVRKAYRAKAKKYHPDSLRAQGLPDEMIGKATEMMAKVNAAWSAIEKERHL